MISMRNVLLVPISGLLFFWSSMFGEYVYPVGIHNQGAFMFLIYQKSLSQLELWLWDSKTNVIEPELLSRFTPAGFALIPDGSGYSFIDNGIIRIKRFIKRSPQSLELDTPIYDFTTLQWIDHSRLFLSARYNNNYGIFEVSSIGSVTPLLSEPNVDYLYPQKIDDTLFFIERNVSDQGTCYHVKSMIYPNEGYNEHTLERVIESNLVYSFGSQSVAFLTMLSKTEGYILEYPLEVSKKDSLVPFIYTRIEKQGDEWSAKQLFNFTIPTRLLFNTSSDRIYESILPLLPKKIDGLIYFANTTQSDTQENVNIFSYNESTNHIAQCTYAAGYNEHYFVPFKDKEHLWIGGTITKSDIKSTVPLITMYDDEAHDYVSMVSLSY